jgi:hypothetical protein
MEGELCKGEATTSFILTLAKEGTLVPFPLLTSSSAIKKCFQDKREHRDKKEHDRAISCGVGGAMTEAMWHFLLTVGRYVLWDGMVPRLLSPVILRMARDR